VDDDPDSACAPRFEFQVSLMFKSKSGNLQEICNAIGLEPERRWTVGEPRKTPKGNELSGVYPTSYCYFDLNPNSGEDLCEMLVRIASQLAEHRSLFHKFRENDGSIYFYVGWYTGQNRGEVFTCDLMNMLGDLQIDLGIEVWTERDSDDAPSPS
jgi:Domain of unknown function (DUF4279)